MKRRSPPRGLMPLVSPLLAALKDKPRPFEDVIMHAVLFGPFVVGLGVPLATAFVRRSHTPVVFLVTAILGIIIGGYVVVGTLIAGGPSGRTVGDELATVPFDRVDVEDGEVVLLRGRVVVESTLDAPLTGASCVFAQVQLRGDLRTHEGTKRGLYDDLDASVPFVLAFADGTRLRVDPAQARLHAAPHETHQRGVEHGLHATRLAAILADKKAKVAEHEIVEATELRVEAGDEVLVYGVVGGSKTDGYRGGDMITLRGDERDRVLITSESRGALLKRLGRRSHWRVRLAFAIGVVLATVGVVSAVLTMIVRA